VQPFELHLGRVDLDRGLPDGRREFAVAEEGVAGTARHGILCGEGKLLHAQVVPALGGNIGESFAYSVATGDYDWYVLELSSFQLDGMYKFRAHIGVLMNIISTGPGNGPRTPFPK